MASLVEMGRHSTQRLPDHLYDAYRRYKEDTDQIETWLVQTVQRRRSHPRGERESEALMSLSTASFVRLAQEISQFDDPPVEVPQNFIETTQRVIRARTKCGEWFRGVAVTDDNYRKNASHVHFTETLSRMLAILAPGAPRTSIMAPASKTKLHVPPTSSHPWRPISLFNPFEALARAEDAIADEDEVSGVTVTGGPQVVADVPGTKAQVSRSADGKLFQCFCLFDDLTAIRESVLQRWRQYKEGSQTLMSASLITVHALRVVEQLEANFFTEFGDAQDYQIMFVEFFYRAMSEQRNQTFKGDWGPEHDHAALFNPVMSDVSDCVMLHSWYLLEEHLRIWRARLAQGGADPQPRNVPVTVKRDWVEGDDRIRDRFTQDALIVGELFQGISSLASFADNWIDHFVHDLLDLLKRPRRAPLSLVFATRLFVEIQRTLRDAGLVMAVAETIRTMRDTERWCQRNLEHEPEFADRCDAQQPLQECLAFAVSAKVALQHKGFIRVLGRWPVWCGLFTFVARMMRHHAGERALRACDLITSAAHVYNMFQQERVIRSRWHDMDFFVRSHTPEFIFGGDIPRSRRQYVVRWKLVHGISTIRDTWRKGVPKLGRTASLAERQIPILKELYALNRSNDHDIFEKLQLLLVLSSSEDTARPLVPRDMDQLRKASTRLERLSALEILDVLETVLKYEISEMCFDPFGLCRSCWALDHALRIEFGFTATDEAPLHMAIKPMTRHLQTIGRVFENRIGGEMGASGVAAIQKEIPGFSVPPIDVGTSNSTPKDARQ